MSETIKVGKFLDYAIMALCRYPCGYTNMVFAVAKELNVETKDIRTSCRQMQILGLVNIDADRIELTGNGIQTLDELFARVETIKHYVLMSKLRNAADCSYRQFFDNINELSELLEQ